MAITIPILNFLLDARSKNIFPRQGEILEFGESEVSREDIQNVGRVIQYLLPEGLERDDLLLQARDNGDSYEAARILYRTIFDNKGYTSIDLCEEGGHRLCRDLNETFDLKRQFDICINNGTFEHVFNIANCFKIMHEHTRTGGLMIHWTPCLGWINHGFYNFQSIFFHDLALANQYEILSASLLTPILSYPMDPKLINYEALKKYPEIGDSLAGVIFRKTIPQPFRYPIQGYYSKVKDSVLPAI